MKAEIVAAKVEYVQVTEVQVTGVKKVEAEPEKVLLTLTRDEAAWLRKAVDTAMFPNEKVSTVARCAIWKQLYTTLDKITFGVTPNGW